MKLFLRISKIILKLESELRNLANWLGMYLRIKKKAKEEVNQFSGPHDCSIHALLEIKPQLDVQKVRQAFLVCAKNWPYGGVTNREFHMALQFLEVNNTYHEEDTTLPELLSRKKGKCVALVDFHFIATDQGKVIGRDASRFSLEFPTHIYCYWTFP